MSNRFTPLLAISIIFVLTIVFGIIFIVPRTLTYRNVQIGNTNIRVIIASTPKEKERGLGGRDNLARNEGMLFVFDQPGQYPFWMKEMRFPLDIIWIDQNFKIVDIEDDISPNTYPKTFVPGIPAQYILEVNANFTRKNAITIGDSVQNILGTN